MRARRRGRGSTHAKKLIVVTAHRRESFGDGFEHICAALLRLARARATCRSPTPSIAIRMCWSPCTACWAASRISSCSIRSDYVPFVDLMRRASLLLTDSGGIQEEGPSLGKPVLVMREKTERPEAVEAGTVRLVGTMRRRHRERGGAAAG